MNNIQAKEVTLDEFETMLSLRAMFLKDGMRGEQFAFELYETMEERIQRVIKARGIRIGELFNNTFQWRFKNEQEESINHYQHPH